MQDKFKVGDYVIFRKDMHKVADMLNTSFYDVLTSVYEIISTEGRCYLIKSEKALWRVWKIRKPKIDRLGTKVVSTDSGIRVEDGECERKFEWQGFRLVPKSDAKREKRRSPDLFEEAITSSFVKDTDEFERLRQKCEKECLKELAKAKEKADAAKQKELADMFVKSVENIIKMVNETNNMITNIFNEINESESKAPSKGDYCRYYHDIIKRTANGELQCKSCPIKCVHSGLDPVDYLFKKK